MERGSRARERRRPVRLLGTCALAAVALSGCGGVQSTLSPNGPQADTVATSWWILFGVATVMCVFVIVLTVAAVIVRRKARNVRQDEGRGFVMAFGVVMPAVILALTFALSLVTIQKNSEPGSTPETTVQVIGHQWWWEVRYAGTSAVTANEIHVPVGTPVHLRLQAADVIHSFWVPELMPKMDLIPGRVNDTWLTVDKAGRYRGQCAEYCGLQHGHMAFTVVADPPQQFQGWLANMAADAPEPTGTQAAHGETVFTQGTCATCHTIRGTSADGNRGPDLTHLATREELAAGAIPNDKGHLGGWIANSQAVKPGNYMPPQHLSPADLHDVVAYLQSLE